MKQPSGRKRVTKRVETEPRDGDSEPAIRKSHTMQPERNGGKVILLLANFNIDDQCLELAANGMVQARGVAGSWTVGAGELTAGNCGGDGAADDDGVGLPGAAANAEA